MAEKFLRPINCKSTLSSFCSTSFLTCPCVQDKYAILPASSYPHRVPAVAERASEVSPDQGVEGEAPDLPEEELIGAEEQVDAGKDEELVADVKIRNLLLGLVEIIKLKKNKYL